MAAIGGTAIAGFVPMIRFSDYFSELKKCRLVFCGLTLLSLSLPLMAAPLAWVQTETPVQDSLVKLRSVYWDEVTHQCRNETGAGVLVQAADTLGKDHYAILTASHVSQGAGLLGWYKSMAKQNKLNFKIDPEVVSTSSEQQRCISESVIDPKLIRAANNDHDLEFIELNEVPRGHPIFKYDPKEEAFCIGENATEARSFEKMNSSFLATSAATKAPLSPWLQGIPLPFSASEPLHAADLISHYSLQLGPRFRVGTLQDQSYPSSLGKSFDSVVVNGMSGSPNLSCPLLSPELSARRCCIDGIVKAYHRYFPRTFTSTSQQINELRVAFFEKGKRGLIEPQFRWSYRDGNTMLNFEQNGVSYQEMNFELKNSGGGDSADSGGSEGLAPNSQSILIPGLKQGTASLLAFKLKPTSEDQKPLYYYANRDSLRDIDVFATLLHGQIENVPYPPPPGFLLEALKSRMENMNSALSMRIHRQLMELRQTFGSSQRLSETEDRACFVDIKTMDTAAAEIRVKILRGFVQGEPNYLYLRADSEGLLKDAYDPEAKSCQKFQVKLAEALFPLKIDNQPFKNEIQVSLRGLFFNDLSQTGDMIAHHDERSFWIHAKGVTPEDLYTKVPYVVLQLGRDQRDWTVTCYPDSSEFENELTENWENVCSSAP